MIQLQKDRFQAVHTEIERTELEGRPALRVVKKDKMDRYDENTYAKIKEFEFHNGEIEMKLLSRLLPDAPDFARGFLGIVFRVDENDSTFESFYVRPANGRSCTDPVRRAHGCQYFSYPGYTFEYFREFGITAYEAPVDVGLGEWFTLRAVVENQRAEFYLNGRPVLVVENLKHGAEQRGSVGIFVDVGTEAFVSEINLICTD